MYDNKINELIPLDFNVIREVLCILKRLPGFICFVYEVTIKEIRK